MHHPEALASGKGISTQRALLPVQSLRAGASSSTSDGLLSVQFQDPNVGYPRRAGVQLPSSNALALAAVESRRADYTFRGVSKRVQDGCKCAGYRNS